MEKDTTNYKIFLSKRNEWMNPIKLLSQFTGMQKIERHVKLPIKDLTSKICIGETEEQITQFPQLIHCKEKRKKKEKPIRDLKTYKQIIMFGSYLCLGLRKKIF